MPLKHTTPVLNADLRNRVFEALNIDNISDFVKINNCRYGIILTDLDGNERYIQVNIKATKFDENVPARNAMQEEMDKYAEQLEREKVIAEKKAQKVAEAKKKKEEKEEGEPFFFTLMLIKNNVCSNL